jgi:hypothetical protein
MEKGLLRSHRLVISTGAYPDFLPRGAGPGHVCAFVKESRMKIANATQLNRKSGVAEWRDLWFSFGSHRRSLLRTAK